MIVHNQIRVLMCFLARVKKLFLEKNQKKIVQHRENQPSLTMGGCENELKITSASSPMVVACDCPCVAVRTRTANLQATRPGEEGDPGCIPTFSQLYYVATQHLERYGSASYTVQYGGHLYIRRM